MEAKKKAPVKKPQNPTKARKKKKVTTKPVTPAIVEKNDSSSRFSKLLTPKSIEESLGTIVSLRTFCKNCLRYVQQADNLLDTLFVMGNSLEETGILKKLREAKSKKLDSGDLTSLLLALMNTPVGAGLFKRLSPSEEAETEQPPTSTQ